MPFKKGNKFGVKGGRRTARQEKGFFAKIDSSLPETVDYCLMLIRKAVEMENSKRPQSLQ